MKTMHILSNSHLDREHRHEFQETRLMMVEMLDDVIRIMEADDSYRYFTLDGQAIVLDDYLEMRPHMRPRLQALIRAGRIQIGPWYSLVDCYAVNPESIIRNLVVGRRVCREFGEPMPVGYSIFSFGQMAQLPQVYAGFGIHDIVFYKGASAKAFPQSEFIWRAPDGTEAFATRLGREKRWNFFFDFDIPVLLGGDAKRPGWQSRFTDPVKLCHLIDEENRNQYATELCPDIRIREEKIDGAIRTVLDALDETASAHVLAAFDGTDFTSPLPQIPEVIRLINQRMEGELELVHSTPAAYFEAVKADIDPSTLVQYEGEMRFGPVNHVHSETMGTNTDIKQGIWKVENTVIQVLEPLMSLVLAGGGGYDKDAVDLLWKYLLATHAHDSIHGSGDPKIKTDNLNRIAQAQCLAESLTRRAADNLCRQIAFTGEEDDIHIVVMNPTPYPRDEVLRLTLDLPESERVEDFFLTDRAGRPVDYYPLSRERFNLASIHRTNRPKSVYADRRVVLADVRDIPAMGYTTLTLRRKKGSDATSTNPFPEGVFPFAPIGRAGHVLDNGRLRVTVGSGEVTVYDYETGRTTQGLCAFTDTGSSGDFWVHREPYANSHLTSRGGRTQVELVENSSLSATCRMTCWMPIPAGLNEARTARLAETVETAIITDITLKKGSKRLVCKTTLDNRCRDHLLTVSFPTGIQAATADWEAPFEIRTREVDPFTNDRLKKGPELERQALQGFIDVQDETGGVALFTKGIREAGTVSDGQAIINLTLFRATSNTFPIHNDLLIGFEEETSQCIGPQCFEYALYFHAKAAPGEVFSECRRYQTDLLAAQVGAGRQGDRPETESLFTLRDARTGVSAVKRSEEGDALILRLFNPTGEAIRETVAFGRPIRQAALTDMKEEDSQPLRLNGQTADVGLPPFKIVTLRVEF